METITVIAVGKIKEKFFRDALDEYKKRLSRHCNFNITELKDEPLPDNPSEKEKIQILSKEGERILKSLPKTSYTIALCIEGKCIPSEKFASLLSEGANLGKGNITFIIGGSLGLSDEVKKSADFKLSFSEMTYPHQLMRVILSEQIYRGYCIRTGSPYHK